MHCRKRSARPSVIWQLILRRFQRFLRSLNAKFSRWLLILLIVPALSANSATIEYGLIRQGDLQVDGLKIHGRIESGDYEHLLQLIRSNPNEFYATGLFVHLESPGGDFYEALDMADLFRSFPSFMLVDEKCASACFLIFAAGAERMIPEDGQTPLPKIGVHRPYEDPKRFANRSITEARKLQADLFKKMRASLEESGVPKSIIERGLETSSSMMLWLDYFEIKDWGKNPPWITEMLIANCGPAKLGYEDLRSPNNPQTFNEDFTRYKAYMQEMTKCKVEMFQRERKRSLELFLSKR